MNDDLELWTVRAFDDAAARVPMPARERWVPEHARSDGRPLSFAFVAVVAAIALGTALVLAQQGRIVPAFGPKPTPSGYVLLPGGTDAATWGTVWSLARGAQVLRPTWLPIQGDALYDVVTTDAGLNRYYVGYARSEGIIFPSRTIPLFLSAESLTIPAPRLGPGEHRDDVVVRGHDATLITAADGGVRVVWVEGDLRYTIQAQSGITREDLMRVAESLSPVVDAAGNVR